jgi:hypothetical protein
MLTIDATASSSSHSSIDDSIDKNLPEPQSFKAVLKLNDDIQFTWLHAINMEMKTLIDHDTFIAGQEFCNDKLNIPVKLVLKTKQTATGKLEKLKACLVARGNMKKRKNNENKNSISKTKTTTKTRKC